MSFEPVEAFEAENDSVVLFGVVTRSHVAFMRAVKLLGGGGECVSPFVGNSASTLCTPRANDFPMRPHRKSNSR